MKQELVLELLVRLDDFGIKAKVRSDTSNQGPDELIEAFVYVDNSAAEGRLRKEPVFDIERAVSHQASSAPMPGTPAKKPSSAQVSIHGARHLSLRVAHLR